jgi:Glyoxalase/Bleomycin resistance protein/Dioxygenase superfamily
MQIDHFAYLVRDTDLTLQAIAHAAHEILVHRKALDSQQAFITLLRVGAAAPLIELVEPFPENRSMWRRLEREGSQSILYHVGYSVSDFDAAFGSMRRSGWVPLTKPFEGMLPGCRASHLYNPAFGIIEIMEAAA